MQVVRPPSPNFSTSASNVGAKQVNYTVASSQVSIVCIMLYITYYLILHLFSNF